MPVANISDSLGRNETNLSHGNLKCPLKRPLASVSLLCHRGLRGIKTTDGETHYRDEGVFVSRPAVIELGKSLAGLVLV